MLTDAERTTATYSNRFASHIVKQHQLHSLCQQRGWRYRLPGQTSTPRTIPPSSCPTSATAVEFWVEPAGGFEQAETSSAGIFLYVSYRSGPIPSHGRDGAARAGLAFRR